jgi:hypothetical protein
MRGSEKYQKQRSARALTTGGTTITTTVRAQFSFNGSNPKVAA